MAEIVNLNRYRKTRKREEEERQAEVNRIRFGLPKLYRDMGRREADKDTKDLDGKKLDD